jgi:putative flippase GtrA
MTTEPMAPPAVSDRADLGAGTDGFDVEIVVPVFNERADLARGVVRLRRFLDEHIPFPSLVTIADNASTDGSWEVAAALAVSLPQVRAVHFDAKGRGGAVRAVWSDSRARVVAYTDVDLSTDLAALLPLVAPLLSGHSDVAIGSRLSRTSRVVRGARREVISWCYNFLLHTTMRAGFSDAQCGFKAMRTDCARALLPHVVDDGWFFDTELLLLSERAGLRIAEIPVDWVDDPDSRVDVVSTAVADLKGMVRVGVALARGAVPMQTLRAQLGRQSVGMPGVAPTLAGQIVRFGAIGVTSTAAYLALFLLLRPAFGAQPANLVALLATALGNTAANRRFTFGVRGTTTLGQHQLQGLVVFALGLGLTSGALAFMSALVSQPSRWLEVGVLIVANLAATVLRFVLLREWVFRPRARPKRGGVPAPVKTVSNPASMESYR